MSPGRGSNYGAADTPAMGGPLRDAQESLTHRASHGAGPASSLNVTLSCQTRPLSSGATDRLGSWAWRMKRPQGLWVRSEKDCSHPWSTSPAPQPGPVCVCWGRRSSALHRKPGARPLNPARCARDVSHRPTWRREGWQVLYGRCHLISAKDPARQRGARVQVPVSSSGSGEATTPRIVGQGRPPVWVIGF